MPSASLAASLAPLRHRPFLMLASGRATNMLGSAIAPTALAFAVLDLTGSVSDLGLVVGARSLTNVLLLLFGGVLADRLPRQLVLVGSSVLSAASQGASAGLVLSHHATLPLLALLAAANGGFAAFALPASGALAPQTVPPELRLSANALNRMAGNAAMIAGTSAGGVLVAACGPGWGLALDAGTFLLAAVCFGAVRPLAVTAAPPVAGARSGVVHELRVGWGEFVSRTWIWVIVLAYCFLNAASVGAVQVLGPAVADGGFGRRAWALVLAAETVGMVGGGLVGLRVRPRRLLLVGCLCGGAGALLPLGLGLGVPAVVLGALGFASGVGVELFGISWDTSLQQEVPPDRLARVYSYDALGSFVAIPVAEVAVGPIAGAVGLRVTLFAATAVVLGATAAMVAVRDVRTLRTPGPAPAPAHPEAAPALPR